VTVFLVFAGIAYYGFRLALIRAISSTEASRHHWCRIRHKDMHMPASGRHVFDGSMLPIALLFGRQVAQTIPPMEAQNVAIGFR
jgi:hypothetical protein